MIEKESKETMVMELNLEEALIVSTVLGMADQLLKKPVHEEELDDIIPFYDEEELEDVKKLYKKIEDKRHDTFYGGLPF